MDAAASVAEHAGASMMNNWRRNSDPAGRREYILAELRCALAKAKLAQLDIEAVALALQHNLVTAEQAAGMFWDCEAIQFLGLDLPGKPADRSAA